MKTAMKTTCENGKTLATLIREGWKEVGLFGTDDQLVQKWLAEHGLTDAYSESIRRRVESTRKKLVKSVKRLDCCDECGSPDLWEAIGFMNEDDTRRGGAELNTPVIIVCYDCQAVRVD